MKTYRPHSFPPLTRLQSTAQAAAHAEASFLTAADPALADDVLEEYRKAGYDDGHTNGYAEGVRTAREIAARESRQALDALSEPLSTLIGTVEALHEEHETASRNEIAGLVEQVARQVIRAELELRPEQILAFVDEAIASLPKPSGKLAVRMHPAEYQRVLAAAPKQAKSWRLEPDKQLEPGECRVSVDGRELDAGCAQRLTICMEQIHAQIHVRATEPGPAHA